MAVITSTELGATGVFIRFDDAGFDDLGAQTVLVYARPTGSGGGGFAYFYGKTPTGSINGPRFFINHNSGTPYITFGASSSTKAGFPTRESTAGCVTYNSWGHYAVTWDGSLDSTNIHNYAGVGTALADVSATDSTSNDGTGAVSSDAANPAFLMNRFGLGREFVGDLAYVAVWDRALTLAELKHAQTNGPLSMPSGLVLLWANQEDLGPNSYTEASRSTYSAGALPSVLDLGPGVDATAGIIVCSGTTATVEGATGVSIAATAGVVVVSGTTATISEVFAATSVECSAGTIVCSGTTATVGVAAVVSDDFERSSVNVSLSSVSGTGDSAIITLRPRVQESEVVSSQTRWMFPVAKITNVNGFRPTFRFNRFRVDVDGGYHYGSWDANRDPMFSYDLETWFYFDNTTINATGDINTGYIEFRHDTAFTADTVYVSKGRVRTVAQTGTWISNLESASPSLIHSLPSAGGSGFVLDTFSAQTDELSRTITAQPLYGFMVSDSSLTPADGSAKGAIVLVAGVHAGEDLGNWALEAAVEFLLTSDVKAQNVRQHFNVYVYPMLNAPGRAGGGWRGSFTQGTGGIDDANRHFSDADPVGGLEIVTKPRGAMLEDLPSVVHVALDFHGQLHVNYGMYIDGADAYQTAYDTALEAYVGAVDDIGDSHAGFVPEWFTGTKNTGFAITPELGDPARLTDAQVAAWGEAQIKAISDLLDSGDLVVGLIECSPAVVVLSGTTATISEATAATVVACTAATITLTANYAIIDAEHPVHGYVIDTISNSGWASSTGGRLYDALDEVTADDSDYVFVDPSGSALLRINNMPDPGTGKGHAVYFQAWHPEGDGWLNLILEEGGVQRAVAYSSFGSLPAAHTVYKYNLTEAEANSIVDYDNLSFGLYSIIGGAYIGWVEFRIEPVVSVECSAGTVVLAGMQAAVQEGAETKVQCIAGTVVLTGATATVQEAVAVSVACTAGVIALSGQQATINETVPVTTTVACTTGIIVCSGTTATVSAQGGLRGGRPRRRYTTYIEPAVPEAPGTPPTRYGAAFGMLSPMLPVPAFTPPLATAQPNIKLPKPKPKPKPPAAEPPKRTAEVISFPARVEVREPPEEEIIIEMLKLLAQAERVTEISSQESAAALLELLAKEIRKNPGFLLDLLLSRGAA